MRLPVGRGVAALSLLLSAAAPAAEFRAGYGSWAYGLTGVAMDGGRRYDFTQDLELSPDRRRRSMALELDTGPGLWPDWASSFHPFGASGDHVETTTATVLGVPVATVSQTIQARAAFDDLSLTARYPLRWGAAQLFGGLTLRRLEGDVLIEDSEADEAIRQEYDEVFPQLHAGLRWPTESVSVLAFGDGVEYQGNRALEWRAGFELRALAPVLLEISWQEKRYKIDVDDYRLDARLDGVLVRLGLLLR